MISFRFQRIVVMICFPFLFFFFWFTVLIYLQVYGHQMPVGEASPKCLNTFLKNSFTAIGLSNWLLQSHFIPLWLKKTILFCISIMLAWRNITSVWSVLQIFAIEHICRMNFGFVYERAYVICWELSDFFPRILIELLLYFLVV